VLRKRQGRGVTKPEQIKNIKGGLLKNLSGEDVVSYVYYDKGGGKVGSRQRTQRKDGTSEVSGVVRLVVDVAG